MESPRTNDTLSASERKRMRDRKARKVAREKRDARIKALEDRVTYCERHHGAVWVQHIMAAMENLQRENQMLRERQERLHAIFSSWEQDETTLQATRGDMMPIRIDPSDASTDPLSTEQPLNIGGSRSSHSNPTSPLFPSETASGSIPAWSLTPINEYGHISPPLPATCLWLAHPDQIAACPSLPSPLDLLHGTRRNFLADKISQAIRVRAIRDPERLASGWLIYVFSKWRATPTMAAFLHIPPFLRPVLLQIQRGHPAAIDLFVFPQIRINLIKSWDKYDFVIQRGEDILERDGQDNLHIRREFLDVFTRESGWGLTPEFVLPSIG
ncbi:hypothetical protein F9C07_2205858 [Aspergillus flavus]|uniref:BZIP domain-containing protein n=1 Tax=Aspergillus flavus (strain ATCC 200026 / FGSC A1120 / IAM 13836 / NRRL 3357 / JCM 12722 / SRRC 167) TaxID=332952 RepID=A0A7U2R288_ASPFN|nr:hypothetical protein F9C07_2205858 [Aspergillus flavus]